MDGFRKSKQDRLRRLKDIAIGMRLHRAACVLCIVIATLLLAAPLHA